VVPRMDLYWKVQQYAKSRISCKTIHKLKGLKIMMRYKITIDRHGLGEYEKSVVNYVFESSSPKDALRRVEAVYDRCHKNNKRIPYNSKLFLEAVAISAETDLSNIK